MNVERAVGRLITAEPHLIALIDKVATNVTHTPESLAPMCDAWLAVADERDCCAAFVYLQRAMSGRVRELNGLLIKVPSYLAVCARTSKWLRAADEADTKRRYPWLYEDWDQDKWEGFK